MKYSSNKNIVYHCLFHVIFCTKWRRKIIEGDIEDRFKQIAESVALELAFDIKEMKCMPDHVHLLINVDPQFGIHRAVKRIKGRTSKLLREEFPSIPSRIPTLWTNSYFVSTVGELDEKAITTYIQNQKHA